MSPPHPRRIAPARLRASQSDHPAERLHAFGAHALTDAELLALVGSPRVPGCQSIGIARQWLTHQEGLRAVFEAARVRPHELAGASPLVCARLLACIELATRHFEYTLHRGETLTHVTDVRRVLHARLGARRSEVFAALFLDRRYRLIRFEELFHGTLDSASVYPREVVRRTLELNAAALIVAHNHPSGVTDPSTADRAITERLRRALELVDVQLLDHVVIGDGPAVSFAERGWL